MGINFYPAFLSDDFSKKPEEAALLEEADRVESAFIKEPGNPEKVKAWQQMQDRLNAEVWRPGVKEIADHIDHAVKWAGIEHVGIGSDFDGIEITPAGLENISKLDILWDELRRRGYTQSQIDRISGENLMAVYERVLSCSE